MTLLISILYFVILYMTSQNQTSEDSRLIKGIAEALFKETASLRKNKISNVWWEVSLLCLSYVHKALDVGSTHLSNETLLYSRWTTTVLASQSASPTPPLSRYGELLW